MSDRLLLPNQSQLKIITLTHTDRWHSILRHYSDHDQRISALDWSDLSAEQQRWRGSVAIVEVDEVNLEAACRYSMGGTRLSSRGPLFAVTDLPDFGVANALAVAGFVWTCRTPQTTARLFRQIERYQREHPPKDVGIEASFCQRLPWKPLDRYADTQSKSTPFSASRVETAINSDSPADANDRND